MIETKKSFPLGATQGKDDKMLNRIIYSSKQLVELEKEDSGLILTTHKCSAVEGLVHSPAHSHQTPITSHCTIQELHSQGNSCTHVLSVDRASVYRSRVS